VIYSSVAAWFVNDDALETSLLEMKIPDHMPEIVHGAWKATLQDCLGGTKWLQKRKTLQYRLWNSQIWLQCPARNPGFDGMYVLPSAKEGEKLLVMLEMRFNDNPLDATLSFEDDVLKKWVLTQTELRDGQWIQSYAKLFLG
jgi:hypothetical protein